MMSVERSSVYPPSTTSAATTVMASPAPVQEHPPRHIWIVTGPAGCGKSTVAEYLANVMHLPFIEGDEYHPKENVAKMAAGIPLSDADRWDWLVSLRHKAIDQLNSSGASGVVLTCSALKQKYRDVIRIAAYFSPDVLPRFVYLHADEQTLLERVKARKGHFMKDSMVRSQVSSLEEPTPSERDVITVDVRGSLRDVQAAALSRVEQCLLEDA